jgi:hypothetical protein
LKADFILLLFILRKIFDIGAVLEASGIIPDDKKVYALDDIKNAIGSRLGASPLVYCFVEKKRDVQYLSEIQICFDEKLQLIECWEIAFTSENRTEKVNNYLKKCVLDFPILYTKIKYGWQSPYLIAIAVLISLCVLLATFRHFFNNKSI